MVIDDVYYLSYELVKDEINAKIYWDEEKNYLMYSYSGYTETINLERDNISVYDNEITLNIEGELYVSLEYISRHSDVEFDVYDEPARLMVKNSWDVYKKVSMLKDTEIRLGAGVK